MCMTSAIITDRINDWAFRQQTTGIVQDIQLRAEFEQFRVEVRQEMLALKELLMAAKKFDEATGQPDCEQAEKVEKLRQMAKLVGIDMDDVINVLLKK